MSSSEHVSCTLFHGPTAQGRAATAAADWGLVIGSFGDPEEGLDIEMMRSVVDALNQRTMGDRRAALVIGPVDVLSQEGVVDVLLKSIEEFDVRSARPYLWANDAGSVRPTILSRCLVEWCPGPEKVDRKLLAAAKVVVDASLSNSVAGVIEGLGDVARGAGGDSEEEEDAPAAVRGKNIWGDVGTPFLRAVARDLSKRSGTAHLALWARLRPLMMLRDTPTLDEVLVGFLS